MRFRRSRPAVAVALAALLTVLMAGTAAAHVTVNPRQATQGSFTKLTFRVPNEQSNASTVKVEVQFPTDHPLTSVSVKPVPGWSYDIAMANLTTPVSTESGQVTQTVGTISWSGGTIKPGEFQEFDVSVGPLPTDTDSLVFKALQTYDDGDVVRWIESSSPGGPEAEHPAPVLTLVKAGSDQAATATSAAAGSGQEQASGTSDGGSDDGNGLAIVGVVLGALGVIGAGAALLLSRRRPTGPGTTA
jgi:uncharacterized protein YcnI